jgi:hypothetical protein
VYIEEQDPAVAKLYAGAFSHWTSALFGGLFPLLPGLAAIE